MKHKKLLKLFKIILPIIILSSIGYYFYRDLKYQKQPVPQAIDASSLQNENNLPTPIPSQNNTTTNLSASPEITTISKPTPTELNLQMTFYSQAPFGDWSMPWQEACEEASLLLVVNQYGKHNWTKAEFNQQILDLVDWEKQRFGQYEHTNVDEMITMLKEKFNLTGLAHQNPTLSEIQQILSKGHFIVAPFAGKRLGNPNYTNGGPNYHAMVIKGFTKDNKIITHDVGTRRGEDYVYTWEKINQSLHNYATPIENGSKTIIEILPPKL